MSTGIREETKFYLDKIAQTEWAKAFTLIGGTAISLQIKHRLSEDLDFFCWSPFVTAKYDLPMQSEIFKSLPQIIPEYVIDYRDDKQITLHTQDNVKIQFFADNEVKKPKGVIPLQGNLNTLDINTLAGLKMNNIGYLRRQSFRDVYDLFVLQKECFTMKQMIKSFMYFQQNPKYLEVIKSTLSDPKIIEKYMEKDKGFHLLSPKYNVVPEEMSNQFRNGFIEFQKYLNIDTPNKSIVVEKKKGFSM